MKQLVLLCFVYTFSVWATESVPLKYTFEMFTSGKFLISSDVDGEKIDCVWDTGNAFIMLPKKPFRNVDPFDFFDIQTAYGNVHTLPVIKLKKLSFGEVNLTDAKALLAQDNGPCYLGRPITQGKNWSYNKDRHRLEIDPPKDALKMLPLKDYDPINNGYHISFQLGDEEFVAVFDTGTSLTAVDERFAREHPDFFTETTLTAPTYDAMGHMDFNTIYDLEGMTVGGYHLFKDRVVAMNFNYRQTTTGIPIVMLIGYNHIKRLNWYFFPSEEKWAVSR